MLRLVALILVAFLLWLVLEGALQALRRLAGGSAAKGAVPPRKAPAEVSGEELVRCVVCGTHVPRSRALSPSGTREASPADLYCSDRCRQSSPLAS